MSGYRPCDLMRVPRCPDGSLLRLRGTLQRGDSGLVLRSGPAQLALLGEPFSGPLPLGRPVTITGQLWAGVQAWLLVHHVSEEEADRSPPTVPEPGTALDLVARIVCAGPLHLAVTPDGPSYLLEEPSLTEGYVRLRGTVLGLLPPRLRVHSATSLSHVMQPG